MINVQLTIPLTEQKVMEVRLVVLANKCAEDWATVHADVPGKAQVQKQLMGVQCLEQDMLQDTMLNAHS